MDPFSIASSSASLAARSSEIAARFDTTDVQNASKIKPELFKFSTTLRLISNGYEENPGALAEYEAPLWASVKAHLECSHNTLDNLEGAMSTHREPPKTTRRFLRATLCSGRSSSPRRCPDVQPFLHDIEMHLSAAHVILRIIRLALELKGAASQKTVDRSTESLRMEIKQMNETMKSTPTENKDLLVNIEGLCSAAKLFYADVVTRPTCPTTNPPCQINNHMPIDAPPSYAEASNTTSETKTSEPRNRLDVMARDKYNCTPAHAAALAGNVEVLRMLHKAGADLSARAENQTVLYSAARRGHFEAVKFILEQGGDFCTPDSKGCTPLYTAAYHGYFEIVQLLLEWGADVNQGTVKSWTPINIASSNGHLKIVEILLRYGADPSIPDSKHRQAALYSACSGNHQEVVKLLMEHGAK